MKNIKNTVNMGPILLVKDGLGNLKSSEALFLQVLLFEVLESHIIGGMAVSYTHLRAHET